MQIQEISPLKSKKYRILLEDGFSFVLYKGEKDRYSLEEGMELSEELWLEIRNGILAKRAKKRAMHLLEKMDRTEKQLRDKLTENGYPNDLVDEAVEYVKSYHYIDDRRYAENYIRYRQESKSRILLKNELLRKGISSQIIDEAMEAEYQMDPRTLIDQWLKKKGYSSSEQDSEKERKIGQFLLRKGFSWEDIRSCMSRFEKE